MLKTSHQLSFPAYARSASRARNEVVLASCSPEERGGLGCEYMEQSPQVMGYILSCVTELPNLPIRPSD